MPVMTHFTRAIRRLALVLPAVLLVPQPLLAQEPATPSPQHVTPAGGTPWIYEGSDVPRDEEWIFGELPNGLRYAVRKNGVPPDQVSIRIRIDAGSLYETDQERGFAHLLEHLLFRQSRYLDVGETIPTWQRLGATFGSDTNAETSPTHTVFKLDLPNISTTKLAESMKLLSGMVRSPVLSDANVRAGLSDGGFQQAGGCGSDSCIYVQPIGCVANDCYVGAQLAQCGRANLVSRAMRAIQDDLQAREINVRAHRFKAAFQVESGCALHVVRR